MQPTRQQLHHDVVFLVHALELMRDGWRREAARVVAQCPYACEVIAELKRRRERAAVKNRKGKG